MTIARRRTAETGERRVAQRAPKRTRRNILEAAIAEFADKGLSGARIDEIARRAGANKRMIYHYFGNKDDLYLAALEAVYERIRVREQELRLGDLPPSEAMRALVRFTWQYLLDHPEFIGILNNENLHEARHLRRSTRVRGLHSPFVAQLSDLLERGAREGVFREGVDPVQLYISIAALGYFYLANRHTLSTIFGRDLGAPEALAARREHIVEVILDFLRP